MHGFSSTVNGVGTPTRMHGSKLSVDFAVASPVSGAVSSAWAAGARQMTPRSGGGHGNGEFCVSHVISPVAGSRMLDDELTSAPSIGARCSAP
jgi:hypothetical protein